MGDFSEDFVGGLGPSEAAGLLIVVSDVVGDRLFQLGHAAKQAAAESLIREISEPAFDEIEPRTAGRREVQMEPRVLGQPGQHFRMLMRREVIEDHVQIEFWRRRGVDLF